MSWLWLTIDSESSLGIHSAQLVLSLAHVAAFIVGLGSLDRQRRLGFLVRVHDALGRIQLAPVAVPRELGCGVTGCDGAGQRGIGGGNNGQVLQAFLQLRRRAHWQGELDQA